MKLSFSVCKILVQHFRTSIKSVRCNSSISVSQCKGVGVSPQVHDFDEKLWQDLENLDENTSSVVDPLQTCSEDISTLTPYLPETFNLAAYINKSETLQQLVKLGVDLSKIEKKPHIVEKILRLNFDRDMKEFIFFLKDYIPADDIGNFLTKNPLIFTESIEDLKVRINYLESKSFKTDNIKRIITTNPYWLSFSTLRIDRRLGFFQQKFCLSGMEVRHVTVRQPKLITYNLHHVSMNNFSLKEEFGFSNNDVKTLLLCKPKLWMIEHMALVRRLDYLHNTMKIPHDIILKFPEALLCRLFKIEQRHKFLAKLGRNQYDPNKENYVSPKALVEGSDVEFCNKVAKCTVADFNLYLKTL